jgi:2,3-diaminopropionate biosynthesis protein SbnA
MRKASEGVLSAVGNTPLVELKRLVEGDDVRLYAKLEGLNPGGSIKDRAAVSILCEALESGKIHPWTVVVESSSGNMAIGLAQACSYLGLRLICVVDPKATSQNVEIMRAYGAEVDLVAAPDPVTGEYLQARLDRVKELLATHENAFSPRQYSNPYNPLAHHRTMGEIANALGGEVDYLFCATSTCGTLRGCAEYIRENGLRTKVIAVDAVGSVIFGSQKAKRLLPGHGSAVVPQLFRDDLADDFVHVTDLDCVVGCRRLVRQEGILAGASSGGALSAFMRVRETLPRGSNCVVIFPDRGERYMDTVYSDSWVAEHFGDVSHLWERAAEEQVCEAITF